MRRWVEECNRFLGKLEVEDEMVIKEGDFRNGEGERAAFLFVPPSSFAEMERIKRRAVYLGEKEDGEFLYENQISRPR